MASGNNFVGVCDDADPVVPCVNQNCGDDAMNINLRGGPLLNRSLVCFVSRLD